MIRVLALAALVMGACGCEVLAPVVGSIPQRNGLGGDGCDPQVRCALLDEAPPATFDAAQLLPPAAHCPSGRTRRSMTVSDAISIDTSALTCVELLVTVAPGPVGEVASPVLTLRGDGLASSIVRIASVERLASVVLTAGSIADSEIHLDGAVRLAVTGSALSRATIELTGTEPIDAPEVVFTDASLVEVHVTGSRSPVRLRDSAMERSAIDTRSIAIERGTVDACALDGELIELLDARVSMTRLASDRLIVTGGAVSASHVARCGSVTLAATEIQHSRFVTCTEPIEVQRASLGQSLFSGSIVGASSNLDGCVVAGERLDVALGILSNVAFCGTTELHASSLTCARCEPGAPAETCVESLHSTHACPGLCTATCSEGPSPSDLDPMLCAE